MAKRFSKPDERKAGIKLQSNPHERDTTNSVALPDRFRIKRRSEFLQIQKSGAKVHSRHFLVLTRPAESASRIGVVVTRKVDKRAVVRNYIRRCVREIFRVERPRFNAHFDIVIIAREGAAKCEFSEIKEELQASFKRHGMLRAV